MVTVLRFAVRSLCRNNECLKWSSSQHAHADGAAFKTTCSRLILFSRFFSPSLSRSHALTHLQAGSMFRKESWCGIAPDLKFGHPWHYNSPHLVHSEERRYYLPLNICSNSHDKAKCLISTCIPFVSITKTSSPNPVSSEIISSTNTNFHLSSIT